MSVLIVDDNDRMRTVIRTIVEPTQGEIYEAADGTEAVAVYLRLHPDWVLMDLEMRPEDGISATRRIRASDPGARVVIVTEHDDPAIRLAALEAGACGFVPKEDLGQLRDIVRESGRAR
jgi:two-component system NarL family response regulator